MDFPLQLRAEKLPKLLLLGSEEARSATVTGRGKWDNRLIVRVVSAVLSFIDMFAKKIAF
jgi:hypothetical protein